MITVLMRAASFLLRLVSVPKCTVCNSLLWDESELCPECLAAWESAKRERCPVCSKSASGCTCKPFALHGTDCLSEKSVMSLVFLASPESKRAQDGAVRSIVYSVKRRGSRNAVRFAAREISLKLLILLKKSGEKPSEWALTYPPRCKSEKRKYGFDQGQLLVKSVSRYTGIDFESCFVRRGGTVQKALNSVERRKNAEGSLALGKCSPEGKSYIILDDVITTGATVSASAALLKGAGAERVFPVSITRTKMKKRAVRRKRQAAATVPWFAH